jgi:hypothetical protein
MKELVGKTITHIEVSVDGNYYIRFNVENEEPIVYLAEGDCCSESWFAEVLGAYGALSNKFLVKDVQHMKMPLWAVKHVNTDGKCRQDFDEVYGYKLSVDVLTTRYNRMLNTYLDFSGNGTVEIIYRNSSNGYYGGWCELCDNPEDQEWIKITEDWSA